MSFYINTNIASLNAQSYLQQTSSAQAQTISQVTSGLRIVQSGDDAAGLAVANGYRSNEAVLTQGIRNANDGLSQLQIVDGGMSNISQLLDQARTLATQSATGTFTGDRTVLNQTFQGVITEINRQAQAIGLNIGGNFAQNLSVFIGGGTASGSNTAVQNGSVSVNLANATVDAKSLGLQGVQATGVAGTDIGTGSPASSVAAILANTANTNTETKAGYTTFNFYGPGFSNTSGSGQVSVSVNLNGVTDANSLVTAINSAIQAAGSGGSQQDTAFANANIVAGLNVDSTGKTQLTFGSSSSAFQVQSGDGVANALMGNIQAGTSASAGATVTGGSTPITATGAESVVLTVTGASSSPVAVNVAILNTQTAAQMVTDINTGLAAAGLTGYTASLNSAGKIQIAGASTSFSVNPGTTDTGNFLGFGSVSTVNASGVVANDFNSNGANQSVNATGTDVYNFTALSGTNEQTLNINAQSPAGVSSALAVNLTVSNAATIATAVSAINTALQQSNNPTLQGLVAVEQTNNAGTATGVRFLSSVGTFSVSLGSTGATAQGLTDNSTGSPSRARWNPRSFWARAAR